MERLCSDLAPLTLARLFLSLLLFRLLFLLQSILPLPQLLLRVEGRTLQQPAVVRVLRRRAEELETRLAGGRRQLVARRAGLTPVRPGQVVDGVQQLLLGDALVEAGFLGLVPEAERLDAAIADDSGGFG